MAGPRLFKTSASKTTDFSAQTGHGTAALLKSSRTDDGFLGITFMTRLTAHIPGHTFLSAFTSGRVTGAGLKLTVLARISLRLHDAFETSGASIVLPARFTFPALFTALRSTIFKVHVAQILTAARGRAGLLFT